MSTTQQQSTGLWALDKTHSSARFEVEHNSASTFRGGFEDVEAKLEYGPSGLSVTGSVRVESIDLADPQMRGHVLSPEFLDAERHPTLDFVSGEVDYEDGEAVVAGELTIRGERRPLTVRGKIGEPFENAYGGRSMAVSLHAAIDRTDFGLNWQMELPGGEPVLGNEVRLEIELELVEV
ncbi:MAG: YceI family protein [Actinobacteria bacterium]|nr:YceI family protein [Actinomycetota bacterium]